MLRNRSWELKYTPNLGDLVELFYVPALKSAVRYDRLTGYFNAQALTLAARGIEGLIRKAGRMRLVVGCTLEPPEIEAIEKGERLRDQVERHLASRPLDPLDRLSTNALELLAWMVAHGFLDVKLAVPCDAQRRPIPSDGIFHEKAGIIRDSPGDRIAWNGSLNETASGWRHNWESISVFTSWGPDPRRVEYEESNFELIWADKATGVIVLDILDTLRQDLMRFMPEDDTPARLRKDAADEDRKPPRPRPKKSIRPRKPLADDRRSLIWSFIESAPSQGSGGERVGEETSAITLWPHQARALERLYGNWPPKLLIADEVGLGKTIQAGILLRQAWLAKRIKRVLILAPKAVLKQWQIELREKFNLNWPIYDGRKLVFLPSPATHGRHNRVVDRNSWHKEHAVITSSQLMRRTDRANTLLNDAERWDLVVLDEAHHARRRAAGTARERGPNHLLKLMRGLKHRTKGLVLLTATPMQVHPIEVWDLLDLLDLPPEWSSEAFLRFVSDVGESDPSPQAMGRLAALFRAMERAYGRTEPDTVKHLVGNSRMRAKRALKLLRDESPAQFRLLDTARRQSAFKLILANTPIRRLVSRHTRELLRRYFKAGLLSTPIADRRVEDHFLELTPDERALYEAVENYIGSTYNKASPNVRNAVGFVMTIYRRRLASSFNALRITLRSRLEALESGTIQNLQGNEEDAPDDEAVDEVLDAEDVGALERDALAAEEAISIEGLLASIRLLPLDSKFNGLKTILHRLREDGYQQAMVFTQFTDTMDFLRTHLLASTDLKLMCFSGRGGEVPSGDCRWHRITRDDAKKRFREGRAEVLVCTDAAAEGLNFQFCGALINYDMPWNPMRVEQRIGRIDRLGQKYPIIRIANLHYEGTVEADVYRALRSRIKLFESVVGPLQPILSKLSRRITDAILSGGSRTDAGRAKLANEVNQETPESEEWHGFNIDEAAEGDWTVPKQVPSTVTMDDLDRIIQSPDLMPEGFQVKRLGNKEYSLIAPDATDSVRVTTDPEYFDQHPDSLELWSPGNPLFKGPKLASPVALPPAGATLKDILDT